MKLITAVTQEGATLAVLSVRSPVLVVFVRHFGCTFSRALLGQLGVLRDEIAEAGTQLAFVHRLPEDEARRFFAGYGLADLPRVSDPQGELYGELGLRDGGPVGLNEAWLAAEALEMPGMFLIHRGRVLRSFVHRTAADLPDVRQLLRG